MVDAIPIRPNNTVVLRYPGIIAEARNAGTAAARTSCLVFTDADVTFALDFFDRLMQHPLSDAVYGPKLSIGDYKSYYGASILEGAKDRLRELVQRFPN